MIEEKGEEIKTKKKRKKEKNVGKNKRTKHKRRKEGNTNPFYSSSSYCF